MSDNNTCTHNWRRIDFERDVCADDERCGRLTYQCWNCAQQRTGKTRHTNNCDTNKALDGEQ